jgi:hypothetical protein
VFFHGFSWFFAVVPPWPDNPPLESLQQVKFGYVSELTIRHNTCLPWDSFKDFRLHDRELGLPARLTRVVVCPAFCVRGVKIADFKPAFS